MGYIEFNYDKLKGKIKEVLGTQGNFAEKMGLDETTISNKVNNITYFTQKEIIKACIILGISFDQIRLYFFTLKVREHEQKSQLNTTNK